MRVETTKNIAEFKNYPQITRKNVGFGSVAITRTFGDVFGVIVKADDKQDLVSFVDQASNVKIEEFGKSIFAKELTRMLISLKEKSTNKDILEKFRGMASNVVDDMLPKLRTPQKIEGKEYLFSENNNLANLKTAMKKGEASLSEDNKTLNIALSPDEKVSTSVNVTRYVLSQLGIAQY